MVENPRPGPRSATEQDLVLRSVEMSFGDAVILVDVGGDERYLVIEESFVADVQEWR